LKWALIKKINLTIKDFFHDFRVVERTDRFSELKCWLAAYKRRHDDKDSLIFKRINPKHISFVVNLMYFASG